MELKAAKELALQLMVKHGLSHWRFEFDYAKRRAGSCQYGRKVITLSAHLTAIRTEGNVRNTILHEIAHALTPGQHHNKVWKSKAVELGCSGERCYTDVQIKGKYKAICPNGHISYKHRRPSNNVSCGKCCKHYNPKYQLHYKLSN